MLVHYLLRITIKPQIGTRQTSISTRYILYLGDHMNKAILKKTFILPVIMFITEILNTILFIALSFCISVLGFESYMLGNTYSKTKDMIIEILLMFFSLLMYYFIGQKIFKNLGDDKIKKYSAIFTSVIIIISYPVSEFLTQITGEYFITHFVVCSPIAYLMSIPFSASTINHLWESVLALLSPISVLFTWLFSKIEVKKFKKYY